MKAFFSSSPMAQKPRNQHSGSMEQKRLQLEITQLMRANAALKADNRDLQQKLETQDPNGAMLAKATAEATANATAAAVEKAAKAAAKKLAWKFAKEFKIARGSIDKKKVKKVRKAVKKKKAKVEVSEEETENEACEGEDGVKWGVLFFGFLFCQDSASYSEEYSED